jgi:hypothetical protein
MINPQHDQKDATAPNQGSRQIILRRLSGQLDARPHGVRRADGDGCRTTTADKRQSIPNHDNNAGDHFCEPLRKFQGGGGGHFKEDGKEEDDGGFHGMKAFYLINSISIFSREFTRIFHPVRANSCVAWRRGDKIRGRKSSPILHSGEIQQNFINIFAPVLILRHPAADRVVVHIPLARDRSGFASPIVRKSISLTPMHSAAVPTRRPSAR